MDSFGRSLFADLNFTCTNCPVFCPDDPSCPLSAPPPYYSDIDNANTTSTEISIQHRNHLLLLRFLTAAGALLALSFLLFLASYVFLRRRRRLRRENPSLVPPPNDDDDAAGGAEEGDGTHHHVWYIRTVGLDESVISSIAATAYRSRGEEEGGGGDCSVCLGEFMDGEMVKLLPKCAHTFHVSCIDTWLRSHVNCPLCRAPVLLAATDHPPQVEGAASDVAVASTTSSALESGTSSSSSSSSELRKEMEDDGLQPIRRSVSMDSSSLAALRVELANNREEEEEEEEEKGGMKEGSSMKGVKRCQSSRSGRFFFPRCGRPRNSSLLPL